MQLPILSPAGERVLARATQESGTLTHRYLGVEHVFVGVAQEMPEPLVACLGSTPEDLQAFLDALRARSSTLPPNPTLDFVISPRCKRIFDLAARVGAEAVGPAELLSAIAREGRSVPARMLRARGVDPLDLEAHLERAPEPEVGPSAETPLLNRYGRDLSALARAGKLSPVIGRKAEMDQVAEILLRRNKNSPVLVGEAGVGKTAIVEGLAQRLGTADCPGPLRRRRVVEVSLGALVAGTKYRGEFEERLVGLLEEVRENPAVIVFLDEIHTLVGAGATGGGDAMDAANIAKPALARGEIRCIGATTIGEYRRHFEQDPALERRFERVLVEEPTPAEAREIVDRVCPGFERHHGVRILPEAVSAAVDLTVQHVFDRRLPDKALDAVDQSCARRRLERYASTADGPAIEITAEDVARTVAQWTGVPLERMSGEAARELLNIEGALRERVPGQDHAVRAVARTILTARAGLADPDRPVGVFLFTGPTGVGKTHLARSLHEVLFGERHRLVRIDMSEYAEEHALARLIGAPPGYVGHDREGLLISALRTHPHAVVLFDEIEKAHPKVFDLFLQIFDGGRLTGAQGRSADFTQAVVILTSNVDVLPPPPETPVGFGREATTQPPTIDLREALRGWLRPEIVNRLDAVVPFAPLSPEALRAILDGYLGAVGARLAERGLTLEVDPAVHPVLLGMGDTDRYGARELKRVVDLTVRQPLARVLLESGDAVCAVRMGVGEQGIEFELAGR